MTALAKPLRPRRIAAAATVGDYGRCLRLLTAGTTPTTSWCRRSPPTTPPTPRRVTRWRCRRARCCRCRRSSRPPATRGSGACTPTCPSCAACSTAAARRWSPTSARWWRRSPRTTTSTTPRRCRRSSSRTRTRRCTGRPRCPTSRRRPVGRPRRRLLRSLNATPRSRCRSRWRRRNTFQVGKVGQPVPGVAGGTGGAVVLRAGNREPTPRECRAGAVGQELRQPLRARLPRHLPDRARQPGAALGSARLGAGADHDLPRHRPWLAAEDDRAAGVGARGAGAAAADLLLRRARLRHPRRPGGDALQVRTPTCSPSSTTRGSVRRRDDRAGGGTR